MHFCIFQLSFLSLLIPNLSVALIRIMVSPDFRENTEFNGKFRENFFFCIFSQSILISIGFHWCWFWILRFQLHPDYGLSDNRNKTDFIGKFWQMPIMVFKITAKIPFLPGNSGRIFFFFAFLWILFQYRFSRFPIPNFASSGLGFSGFPRKHRIYLEFPEEIIVFRLFNQFTFNISFRWFRTLLKKFFLLIFFVCLKIFDNADYEFYDFDFILFILCLLPSKNLIYRKLRKISFLFFYFLLFRI